MKIDVVYADRRFKFPAGIVKKLLLEVASIHKVAGRLNVIFNNDIQMAELNRRFKGKNRTTDVLAFNLADDKPISYIEGEVYVDLQTAGRQAVDFDTDYHEEVLRLCVHGFLHLLGYDDLRTSDKNKMWQIQEKYIRRFLAKDY